VGCAIVTNREFAAFFLFSNHFEVSCYHTKSREKFDGSQAMNGCHFKNS